LSAYADTSFLVSLYVADANSVAAASEMARLSLPVMITSLSELELENAIQLRIFRKQIAATDRRPYAAFRADVEARAFPARENTYAIADEQWQTFQQWARRRGQRLTAPGKRR
jgi:hypothetical protein